VFIPEPESEERAALRRTVRRAVETYSAEPAVRNCIQSVDGFDRGLWARMADEMGLQGIGIPEEFGGSGGGPAEIAVVQYELGRALVPSPYLSSTILAAQLLLEINDAGHVSLLEDIAGGGRIATVAPIGPDGSWDVADALESARLGDGAWTLTGAYGFVTDGMNADVVLVPARTMTGISVFVVETTSSGVTRHSLETLDLTRRQATFILDRAPAHLVGPEGQSAAALARMLDTAALGLAAEQVGGADRIVAMAIEYAQNRTQFGRTIASFQAIKHKLADLAVDLERMESALAQLIDVTQRAAPERSVVAHLTQAFCSETYFNIAVENIQVHGGIGFTWEHPAHLYFRRAKSTELLLGDGPHHREAMLQLLGA
jgi:alkylation response protein AidB-like acyl-CoA dehydrogenase